MNFVKFSKIFFVFGKCNNKEDLKGLFFGNKRVGLIKFVSGLFDGFYCVSGLLRDALRYCLKLNKESIFLRQ